MSRTRIALLTAGSVGALAFAAPASAQSYMQQCTALIDAWSACTESSESCEPQYSAIEEECKCHAYRRGEWVLVEAAVADDNVCGSSPDDIIIPPPPPPPQPPIVGDPRGGGGGGGGAEEREPGRGEGGDPPPPPRGDGNGGGAAVRAAAGETVRDDE